MISIYIYVNYGKCNLFLNPLGCILKRQSDQSDYFSYYKVNSYCHSVQSVVVVKARLKTLKYFLLKASSDSKDGISFSSDCFIRQSQHLHKQNYYVYLLQYLVLSLHAARYFFCFEAFSCINSMISF